jgi:hypothetical protein
VGLERKKIINKAIMEKLIFVVAAVALLSSCATSPVPLSEAKATPADRVFLADLGSSAAAGNIVVSRDSGFLGGGCFVGFYIDGSLVAKMDTGEKARFPVSAGEHVVGVGNPGGNGLCAFNKDYRRETSTIIKAGDVKYFRMVVRPGDGIALEPTTMITEK